MSIYSITLSYKMRVGLSESDSYLIYTVSIEYLLIHYDNYHDFWYVKRHYLISMDWVSLSTFKMYNLN